MQIMCSPLGPIFWGTLYFPSSRMVRVISTVELDHGDSTKAVFTGPSAQPLQHTAQPQAAAAKLWEHGHSAEKEQHSDSSAFSSLAYPCRLSTLSPKFWAVGRPLRHPPGQRREVLRDAGVRLLHTQFGRQADAWLPKFPGR